MIIWCGIHAKHHRCMVSNGFEWPHIGLFHYLATDDNKWCPRGGGVFANMRLSRGIYVPGGYICSSVGVCMFK